MNYALNTHDFNKILKELSKDYKIFAPKRFAGKGAFSDTDLISYGEVNKLEEIVLNEKTFYSPKEIIFPITQVMFNFTQEEYREPKIDDKKYIIFARACDIWGIKRLDLVFLNNGQEPDYYYEKLREKVKFFLIECEDSFDSCFCVSTGTNKTEDYSAFVRINNNQIEMNIKDEDFCGFFAQYKTEQVISPNFIEKNKINLEIPKNLDKNFIYNHEMWDEYNSRCISCGRCNFSCPSCSCFSTQDIFYIENEQCGERRRVWASCHVDCFTDMAGCHSFRNKKAERMRFKVLHKIYDTKERFGEYTCVGCGRCDDVCPEYISFSKCVNKLSQISKEKQND